MFGKISSNFAVSFGGGLTHRGKTGETLDSQKLIKDINPYAFDEAITKLDTASVQSDIDLEVESRYFNDKNNPHADMFVYSMKEGGERLIGSVGAHSGDDKKTVADKLGVFTEDTLGRLEGEQEILPITGYNSKCLFSLGAYLRGNGHDWRESSTITTDGEKVPYKIDGETCEFKFTNKDGTTDKLYASILSDKDGAEMLRLSYYNSDDERTATVKFPMDGKWRENVEIIDKKEYFDQEAFAENLEKLPSSWSGGMRHELAGLY